MFEVSNKTKLIEKSLQTAVKCCKENKTKEAELILKQLIKVDPQNHGALLLLGIIAHKDNQFKQAIEFYMKALAIDPDSPETNNNIALSYSSLGQFEIAINHIRKAIKKNPTSASYWGNLGLTLRQAHNWKESEEAFKKAIDLDPDDPHMWLNMGGLQGDQHKLDKAIECFKKSISIDPNFHPGHVDLAYALALKGEWKQSWYHYEHRLACFKQCQRIWNTYDPNKMWNKEDLKGKTLIVWCEQGIGDIFHFVRFIQRIDADRIILEIPESCKRLLNSDFFEVTTDASKEKYDYHCSLMSLPSILELSHEQLSMSSSYLGPSTFMDLGHENKIKVGICWAGNPRHPYDATRSFHLSRLREISRMKNVQLFSLQKDVRKRIYTNRPDQIVDLSDGCEDMSIVDLRNKLNDFEDTAAAIDSMDYIITADTSILHLAGAMGKPVFAVIPKHCDWRWGTKESKTIWYPTVTLVRSTKFGEWGDTFDRLKSIFEKEIDG